MKIREKLTLQFCAIVGLILIVFSVSIYYVSKRHRYNTFKNRLMEKALNTATMLIEVEAIDLNLLKSLRRNYLQALPDEFVRVYDYHSQPIYKDDTAKYELTPDVFKEAKTYGEINFVKGDRQYVAINYKESYVIVASARNNNGKQELELLAYILTMGNIFCLLVIYIAGRFFARHALKPVSKMISDVDGIGESDLSARLDEGEKKDELSMLAITFNRLFARIENAFERQKRFVANASHELRTPLTTITGEIEVALMKTRGQDEYKEVLQSVLEEAKTLTKLSNDLLKLTYTNDIKGLPVEQLSMVELVLTLAEETVRINPLRILHSETRPEFENLFIEGNMEFLKIAFMNIINNAYKFSGEKPVWLSVYQTHDAVCIEVKDQGVGMSKEDIEFAFHPFYRSNNVANISGSGVGLSLSDKIFKLHSGQIKITSEPGKGTIVQVRLPLVKNVSGVLSMNQVQV